MSSMMHRGSETSNYCTPQQAAAFCASANATFKQRKGAVDWYAEPNGTWLAVKWHSQTQVEIRRLPANACGCT